jgi:hypothetical protein
MRMNWLGLESRIRDILGEAAGGDYTHAEALVRISAAVAAYTRRGDVLEDGAHRPGTAALLASVGDYDAVQLDEWERAGAR